MSLKIGWYSEAAARRSETEARQKSVVSTTGGTRMVPIERFAGWVYLNADGVEVQVTAVLSESGIYNQPDAVRVGPVEAFVRKATVGERLPNTKVVP